MRTGMKVTVHIDLIGYYGDNYLDAKNKSKTLEEQEVPCR